MTGAARPAASGPTSNSQSASISLTGRRHQEPHYHRLRPVNLVAGVAGKIAAVAAVTGLDKGHARVGEQLRASLRQQADEGIVLSAQNQCGNRDLVHHAGAGRSRSEEHTSEL